MAWVLVEAPPARVGHCAILLAALLVFQIEGIAEDLPIRILVVADHPGRCNGEVSLSAALLLLPAFGSAPISVGAATLAAAVALAVVLSRLALP